MQTLVEMFFGQYGIHISEEQMNFIAGLKYPYSNALKSHAEAMQEAFIYVVITKWDITEQYLCYMLDNLAAYKYRTGNENAFAVAEDVQDHISDALGETNAFLTSYLMTTNPTFWYTNQLKVAQTYEGNHLDEVEFEVYYNTLLRAVWIDKLMGYNSNIQ